MGGAGMAMVIKEVAQRMCVMELFLTDSGHIN